MRAEVLLRLDGNSRAIAIPRPILTHLGWLPGARLVVELLEDNNSILVREMRPEDVPVRGKSRLTYDFTNPVKP